MTDPACGSGNFLIVAYRELRQLELDILVRLQELGDTSAMPSLFFSRDDLAVRLEHVAGIEIEPWPAQIAATALRLVDHQANMAMELALGKAPDTLPLDTVKVIHVGNALRMDWADVVAPSPGLRIAGNPPFVGQFLRSKEQVEDLKHVWGKLYDGYLDYVTGWFKKAADFLADVPGGRFAFVSTNSIAQGQPMAALFGPLLGGGWRIRFAHQTFAWTSEAAGVAAVHCVITGFDRETSPAPQLFSYASPKADPVPHTVANINGYLVEGPNVFVEKRMQPLSADLARMDKGSQPTDGGNLIIEAEHLTELSEDKCLAKYLRRYVGAKELIRGIERWCLWMTELEPADVSRSSVLRNRLQAVREFREASTKEATRRWASSPHLFTENRQPKVDYLAVPRVFSETRLFATGQRFSADVIGSDAIFTCPDPDGFAFAIFSSSGFLTWQKAVGGRLKSDYRFSNTVVWNNLPLPPVSKELREQIISAGQGVLAARELHPERSLAEHYNPLAMDPALLKAHAALDRVVDRAFGATSACKNNEERLQLLFTRYAELTAAE